MRGRRMAMVFQDPATTLNPVLTIGQQMQLALEAHERLSAAAAASRCAAVLGRVGIPDAASRLGAYPHQFSGGMRQRVAIAIALLHRPALIVADEPTTALDVSIQAQILAEMKELVAELGMAMIWISHDLATVSSLADRIAVMYAGRLVEDGPTAAVLREPRHPYTQGLIDSLPSRGKPGQDLAQIPGTTPSLLDLPPGCPFAPRCTRKTAACAIMPEETRTGPRGWRCHLFSCGGQFAGDRIIHAHVDWTIVIQESISHWGQVKNSVIVLVSNRFFTQIAAGHHQDFRKTSCGL